VTGARGCEQLAQSRYTAAPQLESNNDHLDAKTMLDQLHHRSIAGL